MNALQLLKKKYPVSYPEEVSSLVDNLSLGGTVFMTGSSSMRNQMFGSDYDAHNVIRLREATKATALKLLAKQFQKVVEKTIKTQNTFIADIKAGLREDWRILRKNARLIHGKITNYDPTECREQIQKMASSGVLSEEEARIANALIKDRPSISEFLDGKANLKYHIIRWSVQSVLENRNVLRDGSVMTLEQAFNSPIVTKIDVVTLVQKARFVEISMNYEFYNNGHALNPDDINWEGSFQEGIKGYLLAGNFFKVLKRCYSIAREAIDLEELDRIRRVLNSDLGRLYNVKGDIELLIEILETDADVSIDAIRYEIDQFGNRLSQVYEFKEYLKIEKNLMKNIHEAVHVSKKEMIEKLKHTEKILTNLIQKESKKILYRDFRTCLKTITAKNNSVSKKRQTRKKKKKT